MAPKSSDFLYCLVLSLVLVACAVKTQPAPTPDQKAIASAVAATLEVVKAATRQAIPSSTPIDTSTPTPLPTAPPPVLPSATSTTASSPTSLPGPSISLVTYTKYNDVYMWRPKDGATRLTDMHDVVDVRLSDDAELIAFKRQDPADVTQQELWAVNTTGIPTPRLLVSSADLAALVPSEQSPNILGYGVLDFNWRPATHELAYDTLVLHEGPGFGPNHDLRLVNADTLVKTTLFATGQGGLFYYSPNGSQIALSNPKSISLVNADGSDLRRDVLTFPSVITYSEYEYHPHPSWADDSASLGAVIPPHDPLGSQTQSTQVWLIPLDGAQPSLLVSIPAIPFAWPDTALSPDLQLAGYSMDMQAADPNLRALHIASLDGLNDRFYDSGESLEFVSWAPDSSHFIYRIQGGNNEGLYGGGLTQTPRLLVADPHSVRDVQWLDGTRFVYLVNKNGAWELRVANLDGQDLGLIDTIPDASPEFAILH